MARRSSLSILYLLSSILFYASTTLAQLPPDIKSDRGPDVPAFTIRPGYRVTRAFAPKALRESRFIEFSADGKTLFVSQGRLGTIAALTDADADGVFQKQTVFIKNKPSVQGMCFHDGWLYFSSAQEGWISRARDTNNDGIADEIQTIVPPHTLPTGGGHPFEGLLVTDKQIYATASDPTNMTEELDSPRKTIYVFDIDGKNKKVFCTGIRNTEKLRYRPGTTEIWGFDHGSDNFGKAYGERTAVDQPITDLNPPEELNHYVQGAFYGHPYLSGNRVPRPEFAKRQDLIQLADKTTPPELSLHAHWAINGYTFLSKDYFPNHKGDIFFAAHGSWNSVHPVGANVGRVFFDDLTGHPIGQQTIVDCQPNEKRLSRPCDCAEATDGTVVFTTDEPPALYRISKNDLKQRINLVPRPPASPSPARSRGHAPSHPWATAGDFG